MKSVIDRHLIAEILGNAFDVNTSNISIHIDESNHFIRVVDDGPGMSPSELTEALRFGKNSRFQSNVPCNSGVHLSPGARIRLRRRYLGWTVLDLARRANFEVFDIQEIEASEGDLSPQEAYLLGTILGLDPCSLVTPYK